MSFPGRVLHSDYMQFAKLKVEARYNLASSGVLNCSLADIGCDPAALALHGVNMYGFVPLVERVAARFGVDADCVVMPGGGCSFANHLAYAAMLAPGDEVLVEQPTYELMTSTLGFLGARVTRFARRAEAGWRLDPDAVAAAITPATRLVVLTNLHNPTGALAEDAVVAAVAAAAARVGAFVHVDEVYRELLFAPGEARTSFREDGNIVVTSSLTKAYGLSGLRCGWILAPAALARRMRELNDLFGVQPPHIAECLAVAAFDRIDALRARGRAIVAANRAAYREILGGHEALEQRVFDQGTTVFPRLVTGDGDGLFEVLSGRFETSLVPGRFFGAPAHVRIGLGGEVGASRVGYERVRAALEGEVGRG